MSTKPLNADFSSSQSRATSLKGATDISFRVYPIPQAPGSTSEGQKQTMTVTHRAVPKAYSTLNNTMCGNRNCAVPLSLSSRTAEKTSGHTPVSQTRPVSPYPCFITTTPPHPNKQFLPWNPPHPLPCLVPGTSEATRFSAL